MKNLKKIIISFIVFSGLFILFFPITIPSDLFSENTLNSIAESDVVIIFNPGGWGNTPPEKAEDFYPIIKGIQETLSDWGYKSVIVPYLRTKDDISGRVAGSKEFLTSFKVSSDNLADSIVWLEEKMPDKKIIIAGLSNGATLVNETYNKISDNVKDMVYGISVGAPFWATNPDSEKMLQLSSEKDVLAKGDIFSLISDLFKAPFIGAFRATGHQYPWSSPEVNSKIFSFLEDNFSD